MLKDLGSQEQTRKKLQEIVDAEKRDEYKILCICVSGKDNEALMMSNDADISDVCGMIVQLELSINNLYKWVDQYKKK